MTTPMPALYIGHGAPPLLDDPIWSGQLSAWAGDLRGTLQELGVKDVLPKPLRLQQLRDLVDETMSQRPVDPGPRPAEPPHTP